LKLAACSLLRFRAAVYLLSAFSFELSACIRLQLEACGLQPSSFPRSGVFAFGFQLWAFGCICLQLIAYSLQLSSNSYSIPTLSSL
jgi:hypothetical protein